MDIITVKGRIVGRATFPAKEAGKNPRKVFQIMQDAQAGLVQVKTITDMSKSGFPGDLLEPVEVQVSAREYQGSLSYTYWGPRDESVSALENIFGWRAGGVPMGPEDPVSASGGDLASVGSLNGKGKNGAANAAEKPF